MLSKFFIALSGLPGFKKVLWRAVYNLLARWQGEPHWTFMNYGYASLETTPLRLDQADEPNRSWIQLYNHVAGAVDLNDRVVLEVGCGRGGGASFVRRYLKPSQMIGIDLSKNAVELCRKTHDPAGLEFRVGDAEHLPVEDASVDAVVNVESSHCYPAFPKFLAEVGRVLRPGGYFLYADFRERTSIEGWRHDLLSSGLRMIKETDITPNVLAALNGDNDRKADFINRFVPKALRPSFNDFAGMKGTVLYEGFRNGTYGYRSFVLQKATDSDVDRVRVETPWA